MSFFAVVLAAGRSSRMGVPKAYLRLEGEALVVRVSRVAAEAGARGVVVVVGAEDDARLASKKVVEPWVSGVARVVIGEPAGAQLDSLRAGLRVVPPDVPVLVWPVDQPFADAALVRRLVVAASRDGIVVPVVSGRSGHPVVFGVEARRELETASLPEGARGVVRRDPSRVVQVEAADLRIAQDADTPEQARQLGLELPA